MSGERSIPWTGTPRFASGSAIRPVPIASSSAGPSPASAARNSTTGSTGTSAVDSSYRSATGPANQSLARPLELSMLLRVALASVEGREAKRHGDDPDDEKR